MRTLQEFIKNARFPASEYVIHPEWKYLYVRKGNCFLRDDLIKVFVLANIEAKKPGKGSFKRLLEQLPDDIVVECVQTARFAKHLEKNGWIKLQNSGLGFPSYYKKIRN